jgi:hypothetical protein
VWGRMVLGELFLGQVLCCHMNLETLVSISMFDKEDDRAGVGCCWCTPSSSDAVLRYEPRNSSFNQHF